MIRHLYFFCFLILLVFSCRSSKKAVEDDPEVKVCKQKAYLVYEQAENYFLTKEYNFAQAFYSEALAYKCLDGVKVKYGKKEMLLTEVINSRIAQINEVRANEIKEKQKQCSKVLQHAENLYKKHDYLNSKSYFLRYQKMDCSVKDSVINSKIKILDSLINLKKN